MSFRKRKACLFWTGNWSSKRSRDWFWSLRKRFRYYLNKTHSGKVCDIGYCLGILRLNEKSENFIGYLINSYRAPLISLSDWAKLAKYLDADLFISLPYNDYNNRIQEEFKYIWASLYQSIKKIYLVCLSIAEPVKKESRDLANYERSSWLIDYNDSAEILF